MQRIPGNTVLLVEDDPSHVELITRAFQRGRISNPLVVARDGAVRLELDVLSPVEARALLRSLIGARVDAEPGPAENLAALCCRLPLALRIAAELATASCGLPRPPGDWSGVAEAVRAGIRQDKTDRRIANEEVMT